MEKLFGEDLTMWTKHGETEERERNRFLRVYTERYEDPSGTTNSFWSADIRPWVIILMMIDPTNVLIVRRFKVGQQNLVYEFPAMPVEFGETPPTPTQIAETLTATYDHHVGELIELGQIPVDTQQSRTRFTCYLAKNCKRRNMPTFEPKPQVEVYAARLHELQTMIAHGVFVEPSSICALALAICQEHLSGQDSEATSESAPGFQI